MTFNKDVFIQYGLQRLTEKSTWIGLIGMVAAAGCWTLSSTLVEQIAAFGAGLASAVLIAIKESPAK